MDTVYDHINVNTILETAAVSPTDHGLTMLLVDDSQMPHDTRFRITTKEDYATEYASGTIPYDWSARYFGQKRNPTQMMFGRWVKAAVAGFFVFGGYETTASVYASVTDGEFSITVPSIAAGATTDVTGIDFTGDTTLADVLATLNTELAAAAAGVYAAYTFKIDSLDRLYISDATDTGASSEVPVIAAVVAGAGTDLTSTTYLDLAGGSSVAGLDAETPVEALAIIRALNDDFYMVCERECSIAEQTSLSATVNSLRKLACFLVEDSNAYDAADVTDIGYVVKSLSYKRIFCVYNNTASEYADAALIGCNLPALEGSVDWAWQELAGVTNSKTSAGTQLSGGQKTALDDKNYVRIEYVDPDAYAPYALTAGSEEIKIMVGRDWFNDRVTVDLFNAKIKNDNFGFNTTSFGVVEGIIRAAGLEAIRREIGVDTQARPFTITMPDPDNYTSTQRAAHAATANKIFKMYLNSALWDLAISGVWSY